MNTMLNSNLGRTGFICPACLDCSPSLRGAEAGNQAGIKPGGGNQSGAYTGKLLVAQGLLSLHSCTTPDHLARGGTALTELGPFPSITSKKMPYSLACRSVGWRRFLRVPSSQMTLSCVMLRNKRTNKQANKNNKAQLLSWLPVKLK